MFHFIFMFSDVALIRGGRLYSRGALTFKLVGGEGAYSIISITENRYIFNKSKLPCVRPVKEEQKYF